MKAPYSTLASSDVEYARGLINCEKGVLADAGGTCAEKRLLLDIFAPHGTTNTTSGEQRPAILIVHGRGSHNGDKGTSQLMASANFWAEHGYVAFVPNYRQKVNRGTYPGDDFSVGLSTWSAVYPAVRDVKASLRYIAANSDTLGVNASRIVAIGFGDGGVEILAACGDSNTSQFTTELPLEQDPTLSTVNADVTANLLAVIVRSAGSWGFESYAVYSGNPPPWGGGQLDNLPPVMQFHGAADTQVPFEHALKTKSFLDAGTVTNCLHVIQDGQHLNFDYGCRSRGAEPIPPGYYCNVTDQMALKFVQSVESNTKGTVVCPAVPDEFR